jgi:4a-hydroxytetrahydrobiopterin dehydratase
MTEVLASKTCTPCRGGIPPLTREQAELFHGQAPDWQMLEEAHRIERGFRFRNFREALTFVQEIGELAEAEGHHPNISFGWGNATVSLQTKKIKGLHENDFIMATDRPHIRSDGRGVNEFYLSCDLRRFFGAKRVLRCGRPMARLAVYRHTIATDV